MPITEMHYEILLVAREEGSLTSDGAKLIEDYEYYLDHPENLPPPSKYDELSGFGDYFSHTYARGTR